MNLHVFFIHVTVVMLLLQYAFSKSLPENEEVDSEPDEIENSDETEAVHDAQHHHRHGHEKKHSRRRRDDEDDETFNKKRPCAVMYKNGEPVGILQPYKDSYQLLPIHNDETIPVDISPLGQQLREGAQKRDAEAQNGAPEKDEAMTAFSDEKYPYIFAKFKIDSRVGNQKSKNLAKREYPSLFSERHVNSLRSTLSRIETNEEGAEEELQGILNDMGLIDDNPLEKREVELLEDEDLEHGTNKINLIKVENDGDIEKRAAAKKKPKPKKKLKTKKPKKKGGKKKEYAMINIPEPKSINEDEYIDQYMKEHPDEFNQPQDQVQEKEKEREKRAEEMEEEVERQIKERLQKIKEEVTNEIEMVKGNNNIEELEEEEEDEEENGSKSQRRKRDAINTLVEEETSDLNPVLAGENNLAPHIRRRRHLEELLDDYSEDPPKRAKSTTTDGVFIIDLNPDVSEKDYVKLRGYTEATNIATTTVGYLTRNLKEIPEKSGLQDFEDDAQEDDIPVRSKKACKCVGKGCKCDPQAKPMVGDDGSNFVYFDGAPVRVAAPIHEQSRNDIASLTILAQPQDNKQKRKLRQNLKNLSRIETKINRGLKDGGYTLDLDPDIYRITEENPKTLEARHKRSSFGDLVAIHGGSPAINHLLAIRERSMLPRMRVKRRAKEGDQTEQQLTLTDMSDEDLFGALPQSFEGELARYKRV